ncbi:hypothetical protein F2Q68_00004062 [Brassica cretica]|uniref:Uncharacterized protein n=1 Tax=Brassica cretica TaxID=69181 RepID=A0A8S9J6K2_BRACR|nr:hypothetical protein F2Q68_00004062 [Brassica cretica]
MVVGNFSSESKISSENSEGIRRIKDSEDIPKKHFLRLFVGISSDISNGTVLGNIPREKRYRNIPTNLGRRNIPRNLCRRNIPRKCIRRDIPRRYALGIFRGNCRLEERRIPPSILPARGAAEEQGRERIPHSRAAAAVWPARLGVGFGFGGDPPAR